jgi:aldehyde:ferredoxin oxidoreductase
MGNSMRGKILVVDLTTKDISIQKTNEDWVYKYVGGAGYGARLLLESLKPEECPLSPNSPLLIMTGPISGLAFPGTGRFEICGRSPLTGFWAEASVGGFLGAELKFAGFDGILVTGASSEPVSLYINDNNVEILDARHLWGKDTFEAEAELKKQLGQPKLQTMLIGQAGENCVPLACVVHNRGHVAARSGLGALMGSKKLKSISVRGTQAVEAANSELLKKALADFMENRRTSDNWFGKLLHEQGTNGGMEFAASMKDVPMKNWQEDDLLDIAASNSNSAIEKNYGLKAGTCYRCPIACKRLVEIPDGEYKTDGLVPSPEYESAAALGPMTLLGETAVLVYANDLCNRYGLDTISTGSVIAFAMECKERGLLSEYIPKDKSPSYLEWGDANTIIELCNDIAFGRGLGKILGYGTKKAAEIIGHGAEKIAIHSKGLEAPMHHPKANNGGQALAYATNPRGACHLQGSGDGGKSGRELVESVIVNQNLASVVGSAVMCNYVRMFVSNESLADLLTAATRKEWSPDDLLKSGERIWLIKRLFNLVCGLKPEDDTLSQRIIKEIPDFDFKESLDEYYRQRFLNPDGTPHKDHLIELSMSDVVELLKERRVVSDG